jgi:hypothetical protein
MKGQSREEAGSQKGRQETEVMRQWKERTEGTNEMKGKDKR